jgi:hypothetical protein
MRAVERSAEAAAIPGILFILEGFFMTVLLDLERIVAVT